MRNVCACFLIGSLVLLSSCDDDPTQPTGSSSSSFSLQDVYVLYNPDGNPQTFQTDAQVLAIRFPDEMSDDEIERTLRSFNFKLRTLTYRVLFGLTLVETENSFAAARELERYRGWTIDYIGPVYIYSSCDWVVPANEIIVRGDLTDPEVVALLSSARARRVSSRPDDPERGVFELPWDDPQKTYDLCNALTLHSAVEYAQPNHLRFLCH